MTLSANRKGVPKEIASKKLKKGEIAAMYTRSLMVLKWKDKKDVLMLSTFHDDNTKEIEDQNNRKIKPIVCCDYNKTKVVSTSETVFYRCIPAPEND